MEIAWEVIQTLFIIGTLLTVLVNVSTIRALLRRVFRLEEHVWPNVQDRIRRRHDSR